MIIRNYINNKQLSTKQSYTYISNIIAFMNPSLAMVGVGVLLPVQHLMARYQNDIHVTVDSINSARNGLIDCPAFLNKNGSRPPTRDRKPHVPD